MNKSETTIARREIRDLKKQLSTREKATAKAIKAGRDVIRTTVRQITTIERDSAAFVKATTDRLALLDGRLNS